MTAKGLKSIIPIWPQMRVLESGITSELSNTSIRTVITLLRLKSSEGWKLIEVREDAILPKENQELAWIGNMFKFLDRVEGFITFWDGEQGELDDNQD